MTQIKKKPLLSFWQIWNMSFGFLGIQVGFALQNANVSRIFETLGASIDSIPILWIAAPVTGLLVQPIIGYMSDRTWRPILGRRRPYFLIGAILSTCALFVMPNSPVLWIAAMMLWILDASINISMEPFRALVGDMLPSEQRTSGFALQTFFIGVGAIIGSALPYVITNWFGISNVADAGQVPLSLKISFAIGGVIFLTSILWTIFKTKEYSPKELHSFSSAVASNETAHQSDEEDSGFTQAFKDFLHMPKTMMQLAVVQFFTWFALFSMWIYTTRAVTSHIYGAVDTASALYNNGADWVGVCFSVYNAASAVFAFLLPPLARATSRKTVHAIALTAGGLGLASIYFISNPHYLVIPMLGVGLAWASILSMPYAILSGSLPSKKMGFYMGVFNFFIVIPQIIAATVWGYLTTNLFQDQAIFTLVAGGASMIIAAACVYFVEDKDDVVIKA